MLCTSMEGKCISVLVYALLFFNLGLSQTTSSKSTPHLLNHTCDISRLLMLSSGDCGMTKSVNVTVDQRLFTGVSQLQLQLDFVSHLMRIGERLSQLPTKDLRGVFSVVPCYFCLNVPCCKLLTLPNSWKEIASEMSRSLAYKPGCCICKLMWYSSGWMLSELWNTFAACSFYSISFSGSHFLIMCNGCSRVCALFVSRISWIVVVTLQWNSQGQPVFGSQWMIRFWTPLTVERFPR